MLVSITYLPLLPSSFPPPLLLPSLFLPPPSFISSPSPPPSSFSPVLNTHSQSSQALQFSIRRDFVSLTICFWFVTTRRKLCYAHLLVKAKDAAKYWPCSHPRVMKPNTVSKLRNPKEQGLQHKLLLYHTLPKGYHLN